jgi:type I restriction enzyme S subunit
MPAHWGHLRAKYLFREVDERSTTGREELLSVSHLTGVTPRSQKTITMFLAKSNVGHKICRPGDVVINTMWAWMGALGVARHTGIVSPAYGVYRPLAGCGVLPRYADHLLRTPAYAAEYQRRSTGVNSSRLRL